jgi:hypothetical protein
MYYGWSNEFLEAVKGRLAGDTARAATSDEVKDLRREAQALKKVVADLTLENRLLKKRMARAICKGFDLAGGVGGFDDSRSATSCLTQPFPRAQKARSIPPKELLGPCSETSLWPTPLIEPQNCRWLEDDTEQPLADRDS